MFYIFLTFTIHNIFINVYRFSNGKLIPQQYNASWGHFKSNSRELKTEQEYIYDFINPFIAFLKQMDAKNLIVVFKNVNKSFKIKYQQNGYFTKLRHIFIKQLKNEDMRLLALIDKSSIAFNGCKTRNMRRKSVKNTVKRKIAYISPKEN